jgi:hypothetical protein
LAQQEATTTKHQPTIHEIQILPWQYTHRFPSPQLQFAELRKSGRTITCWTNKTFRALPTTVLDEILQRPTFLRTGTIAPLWTLCLVFRYYIRNRGGSMGLRKTLRVGVSLLYSEPRGLDGITKDAPRNPRHDDVRQDGKALSDPTVGVLLILKFQSVLAVLKVI